MLQTSIEKILADSSKNKSRNQIQTIHMIATKRLQTFSEPSPKYKLIMRKIKKKKKKTIVH